MTDAARRYALQLDQGKLVIELPTQVAESDLAKIRSFMNWAFRQAGYRPQAPGLIERLFQSRDGGITGDYYRGEK